MIYNSDMDEKFNKLTEKISREEIFFSKLNNKLHSNPIKNRLNQFIKNNLKLSVLDLLRSK